MISKVFFLVHNVNLIPFSLWLPVKEPELSTILHASKRKVGLSDTCASVTLVCFENFPNFYKIYKMSFDQDSLVE